VSSLLHPAPVRTSRLYTAPPDFGAIQARLDDLQAVRLSRQYEDQKLRDWQAFLEFLKQFNPPANISICTSQHVVQYLIWRDQFGKTVVHLFGCPLWGSSASDCACPRRAAWNSLDSLVNRLRAAFLKQGGRPVDNPCAGRPVQSYLRDIQFEQVRSCVQPKQATPMFEDKFTSLVLYLNALLNNQDLDAADRFTLFRDRAFLALDLQAWKRGADLGLTLTDSILWFPDRLGWLFGYTWGKTLRTGDPHVFGLRFHANQIICPLRLVTEYISFCETVGISVQGTGGFLFRLVRYGVVLNHPVSADTLNRNLQAYLRAAGLFEGETLHGFWAGGAITAALRGDTLQAIIGQAHWSTSRQALHYMRLQEVLGQGHLREQSIRATSVSQYRSAAALDHFTFVFPSDEQPRDQPDSEDENSDPDVI
jgi:hypothetical protein